MSQNPFVKLPDPCEFSDTPLTEAHILKKDRDKKDRLNKDGGKKKRKYDNSNRAISAEIRRVTRTIMEINADASKISPDIRPKCGNIDVDSILGYEATRGVKGGICPVARYKVRRVEAIKHYFPDNVCPQCKSAYTRPGQWTIEGKFGSMCRHCYMCTMYQVRRRRQLIKRLVAQSELPAPDNSYSGVTLVNTFMQLNPFGVACRLISEQSSACSVTRRGVLSGNKLYKVEALPPLVAKLFGFKTTFGSFADGHRYFGYSALLEMIKDNRPHDWIAEALKTNYLWVIQLPDDMHWWE